MAPTASLRFGTLGSIHLAFEDTYLSLGTGSHRLTLPIKATATWLDAEATDYGSTSTSPALLTGTVWADQPSFRWLSGLQPQVLALRGYLANEELVIDLSNDHLMALDRARGGDDVRLTLKLQATLLAGPPGVYPIADEETRLWIPRARWVDLLHQIGAAVSITLHIPSPLTDSALEPPPAASAEDAASLAQATARLRQARAELRDQQWEHCVATCRRVLENLARLVKVPSVKEVDAARPQNRTQELRWAAVYHDVMSMASAAHHDDTTTADFTWTRTDAEAILATTAGLLARYTAS